MSLRLLVRGSDPQLPTPQYITVSADGEHTCVLRDMGDTNELICWGSKVKGQEYPPAAEHTQITSGSWHTCALWTVDHDLPRGAPPVLGNQSPPGNVDCFGDSPGGKSTRPPA